MSTILRIELFLIENFHMEYLVEIINLRIKPLDKQKLTALALSDNLSVSAYYRSRLLNELEQSN
jgi:hypothetical protein